MSWKVLVTARTLDVVGAGAVDLLKKAGIQLVFPEKAGPLKADALRPLLAGMDGVLASMDQFTADVLGSPEASGLKIVSRWGVGYDAIDVPAATREGVIIAYTPGFLNETVADYAFSLLLAVARRVHEGHQTMRQGIWKPGWGHDVFQKTLGIIGCGRIGQAMARRAKGFEMKLLGCDVAPHPEAEKFGIEFVSLDELLAQSDFVSLHAALTPESRGLIGEAQLRRMKPSAYLINTARGAMIEDAALVRALEEGWIAGAALDAFVPEPTPPDHPLLKAPNLLLTPHQASFARETGERVSMASAQAIVDLSQSRRPEYIVNAEVCQAPQLRASIS